MSYTSRRSSETVTHISSNTWHCDDMELRLHEYRCKVCHGHMLWGHKPYERCPMCGFPVMIFRGQR